ncbi:MAG: DUF6125 family protein [Saccharofermentans sp.]|nr:DUF6125 family protein [Saccharofermentans sp.]
MEEIATGRELYESYSKDQLIDLLMADSRNIVAMDGVWFQSVENELGMDAAMHHDEEAWKRYTVTEARRIKKFLGLSDNPGLEGLMQALPLRMVDRANETSCRIVDNKLIYKIVTCRVQEARTKKGMPLHPCKSAAIYEYGFFASAIDDRIKYRCMSCYPDLDESCNDCACCWEFYIE